MVLSDKQLREISPDGWFINPASVDLRLGDTIRTAHPIWELLSVEACSLLDSIGVFDQLPRWGAPMKFSSYMMGPGEFVLCHSVEFVDVPNDAVALLFSKSSTGRNGLEHLHAGVGDPGFKGQWTWELKNAASWPIKLIAGQRLMQHIMIRMVESPDKTYVDTGRYQNQTGPTVARSEKIDEEQIIKDGIDTLRELRKYAQKFDHPIRQG